MKFPHKFTHKFTQKSDEKSQQALTEIPTTVQQNPTEHLTQAVLKTKSNRRFLWGDFLLPTEHHFTEKRTPQ